MNASRLRLVRLVAAAAVCLSAANAWAVVTWDETVDGDLSDDRLAPSVASLVSGTNSLSATSVSGDREYVTLSLASGLKLTNILLASYVGDDETGFIGVQRGTTLTEPPTGTDVANILGYSHFGTAVNTIGDDLLPAIGTGAGAIGFTPPLTGSNYTFWIQQTGSSPATYQLDFIVAPEPGSIVLLSLGGLVALLAARRRR